MKKSFLIVCVIISITSLLLFGCAGDGMDYVTVTDANFTKTLPVVTVTRTTIDSEAIIVDEEALLAKVKGTTDGVIDIPDIGQFYYEKFTDGIILQGITFIDYYALRVADGTTFTGPINYWVEFNFADGSKEYLSNVGLLFDEGVHINFKQADDGTLAGVMMLTFHEESSITIAVYALAAIAD
jgi:hypothetical protein